MGSSQSFYYGLTEAKLEEYMELTYLNKQEILSLLKSFAMLNPDGMRHDFYQRIPLKYIMEVFPQIKYNPFCDRIGVVFSSEKDGRFSFEDLLDFYSVMCDRCPNNVKALWAFRIYDFNDDSAIDKDDLMELVNRLTYHDQGPTISVIEKEHIVEILLDGMDIEKNRSICALEFEHAICKMSDFSGSFTITV